MRASKATCGTRKRWLRTCGVWLLALPLIGVAAGCKDKAADPFASDDTAWQLFCIGMACSFQPHQQVEGDGFEVSCSRSDAGMTIEITHSADGRPESTLTIRRLDPTQKTCIVQVSDAQELGDSDVRVQDECTGTSPDDGGCTVTGAFDSGEWDFEGTVICESMTQRADPSQVYRMTAPGGSMAMNLRVDKCD